MPPRPIKPSIGVPALVLAEPEERAASALGSGLARLLLAELRAAGVRVYALDDAQRLHAVDPSFAQLAAEAERIGLAKPALDPHMGHIAVRMASLHLLARGQPPHQLFTPSERVMLAVSLAHRPCLAERHLSGPEQLPPRGSREERAACAAGATICGACEALGGALLIAPHDEPLRAALLGAWLRPRLTWSSLRARPIRALTAQPHARIRAYLGPTEAAFYFEFLGELTRALTVPAAGALGLGLADACARAALPAAEAEACARLLTAAYAAGLVVWAAVFIEGWKRLEARRAFDSGTLTAADGELGSAPRAGFRGSELRCARARALRAAPLPCASLAPRTPPSSRRSFNPLTDRLEPAFPRRRRLLRYCATLPLSLLCLLVVLADMVLWLWAGHAVGARCTYGGWLGFAARKLPTVGYVGSVGLLSRAYAPLAARMTEYENYRTAEAHRNALIGRRLLFELCNRHSLSFFLAFWAADLPALRDQLLQLLLAYQLLGQLLESGPPAAARALRRWSAALAKPALAAPPDAARAALLADVREQAALGAHDPFDDFAELAVQAGHVLFFAPVLPVGPLLALVNNLQEVRADAHKLLLLCRRPAQPDTTRHVRGIGAWRGAFCAVALAGAVTNVALLTHTLGWLDHLSPSGRLAAFLGGQQAVLCAVGLVALAQPRLPEDVAARLASAVLAQQGALLEMAGPLSAKLRERHLAVARLQARARGALARLALARARGAARLIQRRARAHLARPRVGRVDAAARWRLSALLDPRELRRRRARLRRGGRARLGLAAAVGAALVAVLVGRLLGEGRPFEGSDFLKAS